jgi:uncharacterized repeat protein (TIGR01451 family)
MKNAFYLGLCVLFLIILGPSRAGATGAIGTYYEGTFCTLALDSMTINETGYTTGDSIIVDWGDGTSTTNLPFSVVSGTAWYDPFHIYASVGVYTKKLVLMSGGVRIDSVTYTYTWSPCKYLNVVLYDDVNSDCVLDAGDAYMWAAPTTVEIDSAGVPVDTVTVTYWVGYFAYGPTGTTYTFKVITNPHGFLPSCPSSGIVNITLGSAMTYEDSIGFKCDTTVCTDNAIGANFCAGTGFGWSYMNITSTSCTPVSTTVDMTFSPKYTVATVYGASSYSVSGQVLTLVVPAVSASSPAPIAVGFNPVGTLSIGDTVNTSWRLNPYSTDCDTTNNYVYSLDTITSAYDPNHKSVEPVGDITAGTRLKYMLSFENTGNATARNIHILDTLSDNVDITSIRQTGSSAPCRMYLLTSGTHNVVKFDFPGINLPDSSHHAAAEGFVEFTINSKSTLAPGTLIDNKAGIYFDVNPVVMTNNVENKIRTSTTGVNNVRVNSIEVYPNPVTGVLTIVPDNGSYNTVSISNTLGQVVLSQPFSRTLTKVNVSSLPSGMYYVTLRGESGVKVQKFEKL